MEERIQRVTLQCPECDKELVNHVLCLNVPTNEFDVEGVSGSRFECIDCEKEFYAEVEIFEL
ncbi:DNA binding protein [Bacillus phage 035JT004]|nr:DNA binding protein [Bacillus phage 035JT004]